MEQGLQVLLARFTKYILTIQMCKSEFLENFVTLRNTVVYHSCHGFVFTYQSDFIKIYYSFNLLLLKAEKCGNRFDH